MEILLQTLTVIGSSLFMIVFFGLCIFIHELGHFLVARMCGLHVVAFSLGFWKAWGKKINGVEYRIGWLPLGGYVDLPQIEASDKITDENGAPLPKVAPWKRMLTAFAGPLFNVLFALLLGCFVWYFGVPTSSPKVSEFVVSDVQVDKPEYNAGLRPGDVIVRLNGKKINSTWDGFARDILLIVGDVTLDVRREGKIIPVTYKPEINRQSQMAAKNKIALPFFHVRMPMIAEPLNDSPAAKAGLKSGDKILRLNGKELDLSDFIEQVAVSCGRPLVIDYERSKNGKTESGTITVTPEQRKDAYALGVFLDEDSDDDAVRVKSTAPGMPADGVLQAGDRILSIGGKTLDRKDWMENLQLFYRTESEAKGKPLTLKISRGEKEMELEVGTAILYQLGISFRFISHPTPFEQMWKVLDLTWRSLKSLSAGIGRMIGVKGAGYTTLGPQHLSGPAGIGQTLYLSVYKGSLILGLSMVVFISFSLGLFNLLPIPVLDGGHILLGFLEMVCRRPISPKILQPVTLFFVVVLIGLMLFTTFFDLKRMLWPQETEKRGRVIRVEDSRPAEGKDHDQPEPQKLPAH